MTYAAIDCGANSTRLLVHDGSATVERITTITRLGQGVDATGRLHADAIGRTLDVLRGFREVMDRFGVRAVRIAATSAARDAANRDEFFDAAEAIVGARPELLDGGEEGRLSFRGATAELDPERGPFLVVDIGGGSTEFAVGTTDAEAVVSVDVGCVRVTEKFLRADPPDAGELSDAIAVVREHLKDVERAIPTIRDTKCFVGLAGTVSAMGMVEMGLPLHDHSAVHHFVLTRDAAEDVFRTLATESRDERRHNPGLDPGRVDVIVGGAVVLVTIMREFELEECLVSEADILDGLVMSLIG